jgi:hypothetical protein
VAARRAGLRAPSLEPLFIATLGLFGFRLGARNIGDNSMFVHLRTGIDMARTGAIPRRDPYSFTAHGHRWVVQSWLPEWTYGWVYRIGDLRLVVVEQAVLTALLAVLISVLARAGSPLRTALAAGVAVGLGAAYWVPRPLMFGLLALAASVFVVERRRSPWWLVPIMWIWVSSHGSFLLAPAWLGARALGEAVDRRAWPAESVRYVGGLVAGLAVAIANPLGFRLLTFPLAVQEKQRIFKTIVEWHSPNFQTLAGEWTLAFLVIALVILMRRGAPFLDVFPIVGFVALGLIAQRNLPLAAVVMAPALGRALRRKEQEVGDRAAGSREPSTVNLAFAGVLLVAVAIFAAGIYRAAPLNLREYPVAAVNYIEKAGLRSPAHRMAEQDTVGCYLDLRYGKQARVFVDDRYDMFPLSVADDYEDLIKGNPRSLAILDRLHVDVLLWDKNLALVGTVKATGRWQQVFSKGSYVVLRRMAPQ